MKPSVSYPRHALNSVQSNFLNLRGLLVLLSDGLHAEMLSRFDATPGEERTPGALNVEYITLADFERMRENVAPGDEAARNPEE